MFSKNRRGFVDFKILSWEVVVVEVAETLDVEKVNFSKSPFLKLKLE